MISVTCIKKAGLLDSHLILSFSILLIFDCVGGILSTFHEYFLSYAPGALWRFVCSWWHFSNTLFEWRRGNRNAAIPFKLCRYLRQLTGIEVILYLRRKYGNDLIVGWERWNTLLPLSRGKALKEGKGFEKLLMIRSDETPRAFGGRSQGWLTKQCWEKMKLCSMGIKLTDSKGKDCLLFQSARDIRFDQE